MANVKKFVRPRFRALGVGQPDIAQPDLGAICRRVPVPIHSLTMIRQPQKMVYD